MALALLTGFLNKEIIVVLLFFSKVSFCEASSQFCFVWGALFTFKIFKA